MKEIDIIRKNMKTARQKYVQAYNKAYRRKHPGYWKNWAKASPEKQAQYRKTSYARHKSKRNKESKAWRIKNAAYNVVRSARVRCSHNGMEFNLDREWAEKIYTGYCELTKISFILDGERQSPYSLSLDRIDNKKGYTKDNCRFILLSINMMKGIGTDNEMYKIAKALIDERKKK